MKSSHRFAFLCIILLAFNITAAAQHNSAGSIAVLPFSVNGVDPVSVQTAESILRLEIGKISSYDLISEKRIKEVTGDSACGEEECAAKIGKRLGASFVVGVGLSALGDKIIVQYFMTDVSSGKNILIDQTTSAGVEDLETVMKRIAASISENRPINSTAEVGNIMKKESATPLRRSSRKNIGLSFGYLYPQGGYDNDDRSFVADLHLDYEMEEFAVGMLLGIRKGFAMNVYSEYLFSKTDICPYLGGSFGFHWVTHSSSFVVYSPYGTYSEKKKTDGFELGLNTGVRLFHTYNFQVVFNLEFIYTLNSYDDTAIVFTIGIL